MAEFFVNNAGRTTSSEIHGGEYVTQLAYNLGIMTHDVVNGLTMVHAGGDVGMRSLRAMGLVVDTDNDSRLRGLNGEIWDPLPPQDEDVNMEEHQVLEPPPHDQPPHDQPEHEPHQHQYQYQPNWLPGIPSYPGSYQQFHHMQVSQDTMRANQEAMRATQDAMRADQVTMRATQHTMWEEMYAGFSYIFGGLQSVYTSHFGNPQQFPFGNTSNYRMGSSGTLHHDDDDDEE
ncbi:hypothetical protein Hanom_Chr04g00346791 [Helianthus anomalus]